MERTKYTPKRLLSLLLALIMLLGMFPTAALAAEPAGGIVLNSDEYKAHGLIFKFEPILPEGPYFESSTDKAVTIHYTISTATGADYVKITELSEFVRYNSAEGGEIANSRVTVKASDITDTNMVEDATGGVTATPTMVKVFKPGVVIAQGDVTEHPIISADDGGTGKIVQKTYFAAQWVGAFTSENYNTNEGGSEASIKTMTVSARHLPLGYSVSYNDGGYTGTAGIPVGTFRTTGSGKDNQSFTISDVTPTLAGCTFKGWSSDTWVKLADDGTTALTGNDALFQPDEVVPYTVIKGKNTVLTAVWEPTEAANTHTVSFVADVTGVSQLPDAIIVEDGTAIPGDKVPTVPPIREGYTFAHWYLSTDTTESAYNFATPVTGNITLRAKWTRNQVKITWPLAVPAGVELTHPGTGNPTDTVTSVDLGKEVTLRIVLDERYEIGTVTAGDRVLGSTVNGNIYTYTFTADKDLTVAVGAPTVKKFTISLPQGDGYEATFTDCTKFGFSGFGPALTEAEGATSYTFEYGDSFKIKLEAYADTTATLRVDGTKVFEVDGNSDEPKITPDTYVVNKMYNITVGTKRKITRMVTFSLEPYGGLYTIMPVENGNKIYAPADPEIPGYEFDGWYKDAKHTEGNEWHFLPVNDGTLNEDQMKNLEAQADVVKGNIVIYGKLTALTYDVTYNANLPADKAGATVTVPDKQTKTHGEVLPLSDVTPTLEGYTFKGWATSPTGPVAYQPGGQYLNDAPVTLYAVWEKLTYTVTISSGTGYSTVPAGVATVNWHDPFTFTVNVDRQYAATVPEVVDSVEGKLTTSDWRLQQHRSNLLYL